MLTNTYDLSRWGAQKISNRYIRLNSEVFVVADDVVDTYVEWRCINSDGILNYSISFELITENGQTLLNFNKTYWGGANSTVPDIDWESLLLTLKTECEKPANHRLKIASIF